MRVVAGILMRDDGTFLLGRRLGPHYPGCWEFPGGKVEAGESDESALVREWREELGLKVQVAVSGGPLARCEVIACLDEVTYLVELHLYRVYTHERFTQSTAHSSIRWLHFTEALAIPEDQCTPSLQPLLHRLEQYQWPSPPVEKASTEKTPGEKTIPVQTLHDLLYRFKVEYEGTSSSGETGADQIKRGFSGHTRDEILSDFLLELSDLTGSSVPGFDTMARRIA